MNKSKFLAGFATSLAMFGLNSALAEEAAAKDSKEQTLIEKKHSENSTFSDVYFTSDISPEGIQALADVLGRKAHGKVGVKISTGEPGGHNFLSPKLIAPYVASVNGTIVECNTAYGGPRSTTEEHRKVVADHGFTAIAPVDILDADGSMTLPVKGGKHLKENLIGAHAANYEFLSVLSHFKGHAMGGFGGALKNISIGLASSEGKSLIHSAGKEHTGFSPNTPGDMFREAMADAALSVADYYGDRILYINVINNLSVDCDCDGHPAAPEMDDIGIVASLDPVAIDQASVDLVAASKNNHAMLARMRSRNGIRIVEQAEEHKMGSRNYRLHVMPGSTTPSVTPIEAQPAEGVAEASVLLNEGKASCVLVRDGKVVDQASGEGVSAVLALFERSADKMKGATLVTKTLGLPIAFVALNAGISNIHGQTTGEAALKLLRQNNIIGTYNQVVMMMTDAATGKPCELEKKLFAVTDSAEALKIIKAHVSEAKPAK